MIYIQSLWSPTQNSQIRIHEMFCEITVHMNQMPVVISPFCLSQTREKTVRKSSSWRNCAIWILSKLYYCKQSCVMFTRIHVTVNTKTHEWKAGTDHKGRYCRVNVALNSEDFNLFLQLVPSRNVSPTLCHCLISLGGLCKSACN